MVTLFFLFFSSLYYQFERQMFCFHSHLSILTLLFGISRVTETNNNERQLSRNDCVTVKSDDLYYSQAPDIYSNVHLIAISQHSFVYFSISFSHWNEYFIHSWNIWFSYKIQHQVRWIRIMLISHTIWKRQKKIEINKLKVCVCFHLFRQYIVLNGIHTQWSLFMAYNYMHCILNSWHRLQFLQPHTHSLA